MHQLNDFYNKREYNFITNQNISFNRLKLYHNSAKILQCSNLASDITNKYPSSLMICFKVWQPLNSSFTPRVVPSQACSAWGPYDADEPGKSILKKCRAQPCTTFDLRMSFTDYCALCSAGRSEALGAVKSWAQ